MNWLLYGKWMNKFVFENLQLTLRNLYLSALPSNRSSPPKTSQTSLDIYSANLQFSQGPREPLDLFFVFFPISSLWLDTEIFPSDHQICFIPCDQKPLNHKSHLVLALPAFTPIVLHFGLAWEILKNVDTWVLLRETHLIGLWCSPGTGIFIARHVSLVFSHDWELLYLVSLQYCHQSHQIRTLTS